MGWHVRINWVWSRSECRDPALWPGFGPLLAMLLLKKSPSLISVSPFYRSNIIERIEARAPWHVVALFSLATGELLCPGHGGKDITSLRNTFINTTHFYFYSEERKAYAIVRKFSCCFPDPYSRQSNHHYGVRTRVQTRRKSARTSTRSSS